jgi:GTP-binding protein
MQTRNIAIIAHVDHGKTTLVDSLFRQSGAVRDNQRVAERAMDSGDLERERGITILAKCTSIHWGETRVNIVDTPGHADFGGEVERILSMVDGVLLLVDAAEGPMPQTKFVTGKALALGLEPIVVINKIDRPDARIDEVHEEVFDLFADLEASDEQLDFTTLYASGRDGWASADPENRGDTLGPLLDAILAHVPPPAPLAIEGILDKPFSMLVTLLERDNYLGRVLTGRIETGRVKAGQRIKALSPDGKKTAEGRVTKLMSFEGLERIPVETAQAGDIVAIAGLDEVTVADTLCAPEVTEALTAIPVDPPTLAMTFSINDSPLAGRDGDKVTSRMLRDRLMREAEGNVAIRVTEVGNKDAFEVAGRGELQLGVLIETMRREGYEMSVSRPRVIYREDPETGEKLEPYEEVVVEVDEAFSGIVVEKLSIRRAELLEMRPATGGKTRLRFSCPSRGLIGYHGEFMTDTRGTGIMYRMFERFGPHKGTIGGRRQGVLISNGQGRAVPFALFNLEDRGIIMIKPGDDIYTGMIIGEHTRGNDLDVNPLKAKQLTNIRASGKDEAVKLTTPVIMELEKALSYINDDELVEVTPKTIRLRKRHLNFNDRKRASRKAEG